MTNGHTHFLEIQCISRKRIFVSKFTDTYTNKFLASNLMLGHPVKKHTSLYFHINCVLRFPFHILKYAYKKLNGKNYEPLVAPPLVLFSTVLGPTVNSLAKGVFFRPYI